MSTLHCFMRGTLTNPLGSEVEVWVNVHESPADLLSSATYITPTTQESMPIYFGEEN